MDKKIPIENIINIFDPNIIWFKFKNEFKGYELSNIGILRSMKFYKKYPYGILIEPIDKDKDIYELSNNLNERIKISKSELEKLIDNRSFSNTWNTNIYTRNPLITSNSKTMQNKRKSKKENDEYIIPKFTIIP